MVAQGFDPDPRSQRIWRPFGRFLHKKLEEPWIAPESERQQATMQDLDVDLNFI